MIPPSLMYLRIGGFGVWLPLFLLWPLGLLLLPFVLLLALFAGKPLRLPLEFYRLCCGFRGTDILVEQPGQRVAIKII